MKDRKREKGGKVVEFKDKKREKGEKVVEF